MRAVTRMPTRWTQLDELTAKVIACGIEVHRVLGPGLLESVYRECMLIELLRNQLGFVKEEKIPIRYKGELICSYLKLDLLVEGL